MAHSEFTPERIVEQTFRRLRALGVHAHDALLLGISGGADSVALAHVLAQLHSSNEIGKLALLHVNHGLRAEESDRDEAFVRRLAERLGLELHVERLEPTSRALFSEDKGRVARYSALIQAATEFEYRFVVTAHTANDQAETLLLRLLRGGGVRGLAGIPHSRKLNEHVTVLRPWLEVRRSEIEHYLLENALDHVEDSSNQSPDFTRNRVRNELLPLLGEISPGRDVVGTLARTAEVLRDQSDALDELAERLFAELRLPLRPSRLRRDALELSDRFLLLNEASRYGVFELALRELSREFALATELFKRATEFLSAMQEKSGHLWFDCGRGIRLSQVGSRIVFERRSRVEAFDVPIELEGTPLQTEAGKLSACITDAKSSKQVYSAFEAEFDLDALFVESKAQLGVRSCRVGDRLAPFGMNGHKLISDLLLEAGISGQFNKNRYPLVYLPRTGEIVWVPGLRRSQIAPITEKTTRVLKLALEPGRWFREAS